jgi:hypothetical protein
MMHRAMLVLLLTTAVLHAASAVPAATVPAGAASPIGALPPHPRLLALPADFDRLRAAGKSLELGRAKAKLQAHGELPMTPHKCGQALEGASLDLVYTLGVLHRLNGSMHSKYSDFAVENLIGVVTKSADICKACCSPKGCNCTVLEASGGNNAGPRSASLCTGSLGQALGVAYDWFYHAMTPAQRQVMRHAIVTQGE